MTDLSLGKSTYSFTGAAEEYTVPAGVSHVRVKLWGGAGCGGWGNNTIARGGPGGFINAVFAVTPGDVLKLEIGQGGQPPVINVRGGNGGWPDGGYGSRASYYGGGAGGSSRFYINDVLMGVAGAGGSAAGFSHYWGGPGGGRVGGTATLELGTRPGSTVGTGGTQTTGGYDQSTPADAAKQGGYLRGGNADASQTATTNQGGGGGGGGYYGGGGGGAGDPGGGGSSFLHSSAIQSWTFGGAFLLPGGVSDSDYVAGVGVGSLSSTPAVAAANPGGNGYGVINTDISEIYPKTEFTQPIMDQWGAQRRTATGGGRRASWRNPATGVNNVPATGVSSSWTSVSNVTNSDIFTDSMTWTASTSLGPYVYLSNYQFEIPDDAVIKGITVFVMSGPTALANNIDETVKLALAPSAATLSSANRAFGTAQALQTLRTYGGAADMWGETTATLTPAIINSTAFGVVLRRQALSASQTFTIRQVGIQVTYEVVVDGANSVTQQTVEIIAPTEVKPAEVTQMEALVIWSDPYQPLQVTQEFVEVIRSISSTPKTTSRRRTISSSGE